MDRASLALAGVCLVAVLLSLQAWRSIPQQLSSSEIRQLRADVTALRQTVLTSLAPSPDQKGKLKQESLRGFGGEAADQKGELVPCKNLPTFDTHAEPRPTVAASNSSPPSRSVPVPLPTAKPSAPARNNPTSTLLSQPAAMPLAPVPAPARKSGNDVSFRESFGFFDYSDAEWALKKRIVRLQNARQIDGQGRYLDGRTFYQRNWEPNFSCGYEERIGQIGDGGKWVCDPFRITRKTAEEGCIILSVGSENDFSFEREAHKINPNCVIHTFDHTISPKNVPSYVQFHKWGLGLQDAGPIRTIPSILKELQLLDKQIDILKIDCEGCEFSIFNQFFWTEGFFRQILIEMHFSKARSPHVAQRLAAPLVSKTVQLNHDMFKAFRSNGYVIFHKEPNIQHAGGDCTEFSFLKLNVTQP